MSDLPEKDNNLNENTENISTRKRTVLPPSSPTPPTTKRLPSKKSVRFYP